MQHGRRVLAALPVHPVPAINPEQHALRVGGAVRTPASYGLRELRALADASYAADFTCLEGWVVPAQRWGGVPLRVLLGRAQPLHDAAAVEIGAGEFSIVLPLAQAQQALLALELGGAPLPVVHGGPARLVVPGGECYTSIKWVDRIAVRGGAAGPAGTARAIAMRRLGLDPEAQAG